MSEPRRSVVDGVEGLEVSTGTASACRRCGLPDRGEAVCVRCGMPWVSGVPAVVDLLPAGVRGASTARAAAALLVDAVPLVALVAGAFPLGGGVVWLLGLAAVAYVVVSLVVWGRTGRSLGRRLLGLRSVDARTGEPLGLRRLLGGSRPGGRSGRLLADLRAGRDPLDPSLPARSELEARRLAARRDDPSTSTSPAERALLSYAGQSARRVRRGTGTGVALVLGNGQRHEVGGALLLGRSPVDTAEEGAVLAAWPDLSRRLAKTHLRAEHRDGLLWVTDLGSGSGTSLVGPDGLRHTLEPGVPSAAVVGTTIECGGRTVRVVPDA